MQLDWPAVAAIAALLSIGFTAVIFIVRSEGKSLHGENKLQGVRIDNLERRIGRMEDVLEKIADFQNKVSVIDERQLQTGKRQDEADKRANELATRLHELQRHPSRRADS